MTKRLTLTEYRQQNAVWLSNNKKQDENAYNFTINQYILYLTIYGLTKKQLQNIYSKCIESVGEYSITSEQIEEILADEVKHEMD